MIFRELKHAGVSQGAAIGRRQPNCCFNGERDCFINAAVPGLAVDTLLVTLFGMSEAKPDLKQSLTHCAVGHAYRLRPALLG